MDWDNLLAVFLSCVFLVFVYMTVWYLVSLVVKRADLADVAWGLGFVTIAGFLLVRSGAPMTLRQYIIAALVAVWGLRLAYHVARRNLRPGHAEDPRYAAWRRDWGKWFVLRSYLQVFLLQGVFMLMIAAPVIVSGAGEGPAFGTIEILGIAVWLIGFAFESVGDAQLARFLADPANRGHIMDQGLWEWTRHPNYFGEATMWWGLAIMCLGIPGGLVALVGPVTITFLLLKVSGVPLLEASMEKNPEWAAYKARTSVFIPRPPRRG